MEAPAKYDFSAKYSTYGISGALGLSDQGSSQETFMGQSCITGGEELSGGRVEGG